MKNKILGMLLLLLVGIILLVCSTTPTGRKQVILLSDAEMNEMGAKAFEDIKTKVPIERNANINNYVRCIANLALKETEDPTGVPSWEIVVFRDPAVNAFALPGGKIGVYTGILTVANNQDKLAAVIGHEIAHVIARHGNERVSQSTIVQGGVSVIKGVGNENLAGILGAGATVGVILPFSRKHETEADILGLDIMARAGFDPRESIKLWEGMKEVAGGKAPPEFLSTHPSSDTRIRDLQSRMNDAIMKQELARKQGKVPNCKM